MMNPEVKTQWIEALESGEYKQCKGYLTVVASDGSESHCCLGVLTELAVKAGVIKRSSGQGPVDRGIRPVGYGDSMYPEKSVTPAAVMEWADLEESIPSVPYGSGTYGLAALNDGEDDDALTFPQIAALIREHL